MPAIGLMAACMGVLPVLLFVCSMDAIAAAPIVVSAQPQPGAPVVLNNARK